jgi:hypothetical protein
MDHADADATAQAPQAGPDPAGPPETAARLAPLRPLTRARCRHCRRDDRPVWDGVCGWCAVRE